jgi:hypothetical protein
MTTTPTPSPEAEALPTLPVVAWQYRWKDRPDRWFAMDERNGDSFLRTSPQIEIRSVTPQAPAEAAIVALRAERDEWRIRAVEAQISLEDYKSSFWKAAELRDALRTPLEIIGLGNSSNPQVDAADALVEFGLWRREAVDEMRTARASLLGDGGTL